MDQPVIDKTIHELARLRILATLAVVESGDYAFLMQSTGLSWGNLSVQISRLKEAGFVEVEKGFVNNKPNTRVGLSNAGHAAFRAYKRDIAWMLGF